MVHTFAMAVGSMEVDQLKDITVMQKNNGAVKG